MNRIGAASAQQTVGFCDDGPLAALSLHGEHRLTDHGVGAFGFQPRVRCVVQSAARRNGRCILGRQLGDDVHHLRVAVDAAIAFRLAPKNELRGTAKAGREFDDVLAFQLGFRQHAPGQLLAARAQNALTDAGEQPVSLQMLHITI